MNCRSLQRSAHPAHTPLPAMLAGCCFAGARVRAMDYTVRRARTGDVKSIRRLIDANVASGRLLDKPTVMLYEGIQEFLVAERSDGAIVGCGALHVLWEDL